MANTTCSVIEANATLEEDQTCKHGRIEPQPQNLRWYIKGISPKTVMSKRRIIFKTNSWVSYGSMFIFHHKLAGQNCKKCLGQKEIAGVWNQVGELLHCQRSCKSSACIFGVFPKNVDQDQGQPCPYHQYSTYVERAKDWYGAA